MYLFGGHSFGGARRQRTEDRRQRTEDRGGGMKERL